MLGPCRTTPSSSAPGSPACTSSTGCASSACRVRVFEAGDGVGGTWYWNRYPGRALRFRELDLRLLLLRRAAARVGVERALLGAAGDAALLQLRRRQARPAPRHRVQLPGHGGASTTRRRTSGRSRPTDGRRARGALPDHRDRPAVGADHADDPGRRELPRRGLPHRRLAARAGELRGQARRGDRHRRDRRAGDHRDRQDGRPPHRVPAHAELVRAAAQQPDRRRRRSARIKATLPGDLRDAAARPSAASSTTPTRATRSR